MQRIKSMEKYASTLISASITNIECRDSKSQKISSNINDDMYEFHDEGCKPTDINEVDCENYNKIRERVRAFNNLNCGFSCHKRKKTYYNQK